MSKNANEPAYGFSAQIGVHGASRGLTKRELFAAMAMQGILANPDGSMVQWDEERVASASAQHADALLAELESQP